MSFKRMCHFSIKDIIEIAIFSALAIVFDKVFGMIKLGSSGGSLNIAAVPLFIMALRLGPVKGFIGCGIVFGLISNLLDGYGIQTYPLEYMVAFGSIGLAGFFGPMIIRNYNQSKSGKFMAVFSILVLCLGWFMIRMACATIDSMLFYNVDFYGGLVYNLPYCGFSALFVGIVLASLLPVFIITYKRYPSDFLKYSLKED